jgi:tRNA-dihydrouridine synthase B
VMVARGSLGNPWIFEQLVGARERPPSREEVVAELTWIIDRAEQHWGPARAARNLRKFYPWYLERLQITGSEADSWQRTETLGEVRARVAELDFPAVGASL